MEETDIVRSLAALAQPHRLQVFRRLVVAGLAGLTPGDLAQAMGLPNATLSFHLKELVHAGLIHAERQGRHLIYRVDVAHMNGVLSYLTENCCQGAEPCLVTPSTDCACERPLMTPTPPPIHVLFLCTHNSARSILAEGLLNHLGQGRFKAHSAGSSPRPQQRPHPLAIETLQQAGIATEGLRSKSWDEFASPDAPHMDLIVTVCDSAAGEVCPVWPGHPATAHWGYADPSAGEGSEDEKRAAFRHTLHLMRLRIEGLIQLPAERLDRLTIGASARALAQNGGQA